MLANHSRRAGVAVARRFSSVVQDALTVMCNGVWDCYHAGHANAWLQARRATNAAELVVAVHDSADTEKQKGRQTVYSDEERCAIALSCAWVDRIVPNVPYSVITEELLDAHGANLVAHGDDMIILPDKPHMYTCT